MCGYSPIDIGDGLLHNSSMEQIKCEHCGELFTPKTGRARFCKRSCYWNSWRASKPGYMNQKQSEYRARRYNENGKWLDEGPKAKELKAWITELKSAPCSDCGGVFPTCCMDFDHVDGNNKLHNVGSMVARHYSKELIAQEIEKCDLVCANCHRIRTKNRRTGSGVNKQREDGGDE